MSILSIDLLKPSSFIMLGLAMFCEIGGVLGFMLPDIKTSGAYSVKSRVQATRLDELR